MTDKYIVENAGERLDVFAARASGLTRSRIKILSDAGRVTLNGAAVKAGAILRAGDAVEVTGRDDGFAAAAPAAEDIPVRVVYEDDDVAVVDKPQGLVVHPAGGNRSGTLVNALLFRLKSLGGGGEARPGIVHRLDKMTGGLMVVAKNDAAHLSLSRQIAERSAERIYTGLVEGAVRGDEGTIDKPLGRDPKDRKKFAVRSDGRRAVTRWRVLKRYAAHTLVEFKLETGRTHQIRVHCKSMNHPIVCDREYGYKKRRFSVPGQLLYAVRLSFDHPATGERLTFNAPLPPYFQKVLNVLERENRGLYRGSI